MPVSMSSGVHAALMATRLCKTVNLFGFSHDPRCAVRTPSSSFSTHTNPSLCFCSTHTLLLLLSTPPRNTRPVTPRDLRANRAARSQREMDHESGPLLQERGAHRALGLGGEPVAVRGMAAAAATPGKRPGGQRELMHLVLAEELARRGACRRRRGGVPRGVEPRQCGRHCSLSTVLSRICNSIGESRMAPSPYRLCLLRPRSNSSSPSSTGESRPAATSLSFTSLTRALHRTALCGPPRFP